MGSADLTHRVGQALMVLIPMILSLTVHEFAHAFMAKGLGDDTADRLGRLTLNPMAHIDPIGTVLLPFSLLLMNGAMGGILPFFGWAKPVPFNGGRFRRSVSVRTGTMLVAAAGPLANLALSFLSACILSATEHGWLGGPMPEGLATLAKYMIFMNIGLFVFNLIPLYPLDGQKVVAGLLHPSAAIKFERFNQQFGMWALWGIVFFAGSIIARPVMLVAGAVLAAVGLG